MTELLDATFKQGKVVTNAREVIIKIPPQYCTFSATHLGRQLKQMGLELPWIANTSQHFYTTGFMITNRSYVAFKTRGECGAIRVLQGGNILEVQLNFFSRVTSTPQLLLKIQEKKLISFLYH